MKVTLFNIVFLYCFYAFATSCNSSTQKGTLKEGDILFQNLNCGKLCDAIKAVTKGIEGKDFSHCALVISMNDTLKVVEAIGDRVQTNSLGNFFMRSGDTSEIKNITIGRIKDQYKNLIPEAILNAKQLIGQPYDEEFIIDNGKLYCSELIYEIFKKANNQNVFFELEPMSFKNPKNNLIFPAWIDYYKQINTEIPEGKAGINPGLISRSNKIKIINIDGFK